MTDREDDAASLRRAFAAFDGQAPIGGCPEPEAIWTAVRGERPTEDTRAIVLHTAACASCAEAWRIAQGAAADLEMAGDGPTAARSAVGQPGPAWRSVWVVAPGLAAAALLLFTLLNDTSLLSRLRSSPQLREGTIPVVSTLVPDGSALDRDHFVLRWTPGPGGANYNVQVTTEDLTVVAARWSLAVPEYQVPAATLASLPSGTKLFWQVVVVSPDQAQRTSPTYTVRVR